MITEDYVSYEIGKLLKEKGFEGDCKHVNAANNNPYNNSEACISYPQPTLQMVMKWLREVHHMIIVPQPLSFSIAKDYLCENWVYNLWADDNLEIGEPYDNQIVYSSYEEACEAAIKYCLENLI